MSKTTLTGSYPNGYTLTGTSPPVTVTGTIMFGTSTAPSALYAQGPAAWTITNQGSILGATAAGIVLGAGGSISNSRYISGHFGVYVLSGSGSVTNNGTINAVNAGTTQSADQAIGILLSAGGYVNNRGQLNGQGVGIAVFGTSAAANVVNSGVINGAAYDGVYLQTGNVTNTAGGEFRLGHRGPPCRFGIEFRHDRRRGTRRSGVWRRRECLQSGKHRRHLGRCNKRRSRHRD